MRNVTQSRLETGAMALVLALAIVTQAQAVPLLTNGGFETNFTGWTRLDAVGSEGTFAVQSGTTSPVNGTTVPAPPEGTRAAMTDAQGPGSHVLYQDFTVPTTLSNTTLSFALFIGNRANAFFTPAPASLDFSTPALNQQARVDILRGGADPFSVASADVLQNLFQTNPAAPLVSGYTSRSVDLSALLNAHLGETLRLRFAEADNVNSFQFGVDNVSLEATPGTPIPEPGTWFLLLTGCASLLGYRWRRRTQTA